jgi:hypothetical protein
MQAAYLRDLETLAYAHRDPARRLIELGEAPVEQGFFNLLIGDAEAAIDADRTGKLRHLLTYLRKHMPRQYWGSPMRVKAWAIIGGYRRFDDREQAS